MRALAALVLTIGVFSALGSQAGASTSGSVLGVTTSNRLVRLDPCTLVPLRGAPSLGLDGYSTRIVDTRTHRVVAKSPLIFENSAFSPDGRFVAVPGFDTVIDRVNGLTVATLKGLRAVDVSWQPLCKRFRTTP